MWCWFAPAASQQKQRTLPAERVGTIAWEQPPRRTTSKAVGGPLGELRNLPVQPRSRQPGQATPIRRGRVCGRASIIAQLLRPGKRDRRNERLFFEEKPVVCKFHGVRRCLLCRRSGPAVPC